MDFSKVYPLTALLQPETSHLEKEHMVKPNEKLFPKRWLPGNRKRTNVKWPNLWHQIQVTEYRNKTTTLEWSVWITKGLNQFHKSRKRCQFFQSTGIHFLPYVAEESVPSSTSIACCVRHVQESLWKSENHFCSVSPFF